jgi:hypothetical protein
VAQISSQGIYGFDGDGRQQRLMEEKQVGENRREIDENSFFFFLPFLSIRK